MTTRGIGWGYIVALVVLCLVTGSLGELLLIAAGAAAAYFFVRHTLQKRSERAHDLPVAFLSRTAEEVRKNNKKLRREYEKAQILFGPRPTDEQRLVLFQIQTEMDQIENDPEYAEKLELKIVQLANSGLMDRTLQRIGICASLTAGAMVVQPWVGILALAAYQVHRMKVENNFLDTVELIEN